MKNRAVTEADILPLDRASLGSMEGGRVSSGRQGRQQKAPIGDASEAVSIKGASCGPGDAGGGQASCGRLLIATTCPASIHTRIPRFKPVR